jgi:hypothetical protein
MKSDVNMRYLLYFPSQSNINTGLLFGGQAKSYCLKKVETQFAYHGFYIGSAFAYSFCGALSKYLKTRRAEFHGLARG